MGKVYLIGAGPGDVGLFTLKGNDILQRADVVVYDALVSESVLALVPTTAKTIHVGKRASHHTVPQAQINQILVEQARQHEIVVRLKGGDPFLFGRGGEELELLQQQHIPFEVVPGVTSSIAVPAYQGIPVTHRACCSSLHIITGHKKAGNRYDIDFDALVRTKGTLVFLMGISALQDICDGLLTAGMDRKTPAAVLQQGTTARQKKIMATVSDLPQEVARQGVITPAIIVVGAVCKLSDQFDWFARLPLAGLKVLVPRPKELASVLSQKLRDHGAQVVEMPTIETHPLDTPAVLEAIAQLSRYQWIVLTSPTGVAMFFDQLQKQQVDLRALNSHHFAVVGTGTQKALASRGIYADLMPEIFDGIHLAQALCAKGVKGQRILLPRASKASNILPEKLTAQGAVVSDVAFYETVACHNPLLAGRLQDVDCVLFTSSSSVEHFVHANPDLDLQQMTALCIGTQTKQTAERFGMPTKVSAQASIDSLLELTCQFANTRKGE